MIKAGIDLGTTFSLIAQVNYEGVPSLFPDRHDASLFRTPSVAHIGSSGCFVGGTVEDLLEDDSELSVARFAKLALGSNSPVYTDGDDRSWSAEAICALILKKLKADAEAFSHEPLGQVVVTVPAQWDDVKRRATRQACQLAGLRVSKLVEEPLAAAVYLGVTQQKEQTLLVYDMGGGTFDATILRCGPDGVTVLATDGDAETGGKWIDESIMELVAKEFERRHQEDIRGRSDVMNELRRLAEQTKIKLCKPGKKQVRLNTLLGGAPIEFAITRRHLNRMVDPLIDKSLVVCERCLSANHFDWSSIDSVMLVGGSSLIPAVAERLAEQTGKGAENILCKQPHQAVVFGASMFAAETAPITQETVASHDLGLRVRNSDGSLGVQPIITANTPLPSRESQTFLTSRADQKRLVLEVVQSKGTSETSSLGHFVFGPIQEPRVGYPVNVTFEYDQEGLVKVSADDPTSGKSIGVSISGDEYAGELSPQDVTLVENAQVN